MKRVWLSIDWDFFCFEDPYWCLDHSEALPAPIQDFVWLSRAAGLRQHGLRIESLTSPERFTPKASEFWDTLVAGGLQIRPWTEVYVAVSHALAAPWFRSREKAGRNRWCVNVDAHHDLGYLPIHRLKSLARARQTEAGSWLWNVMNRWRYMKVQLWFPQWKDLDDGWPEGHRPTTYPQIAARVTPETLTPEAVQRFAQDGAVIDSIFICRSDAWTPPCHDQAFAEFVTDMARRHDCLLRGFTSEGTDPMDPRSFSMEQAEEYAEKLKVLEEISKANKT